MYAILYYLLCIKVDFNNIRNEADKLFKTEMLQNINIFMALKFIWLGKCIFSPKYETFETVNGSGKRRHYRLTDQRLSMGFNIFSQIEVRFMGTQRTDNEWLMPP